MARRDLRVVAWLLVLLAGVLLGSHALRPGRAPRARPVATPSASSDSAAWSGVPALAQLAISRALGADDHAYWVTTNDSVVFAHNARQALSASFGAAGLSIATADGRLSLRLRSVSGHSSPSVAPNAHLNRVSYRRGAVTEWYANGPAGLEQGFRVARPVGGGAHTLTLGLALGGTLRARPLAGGHGISFLAPDGQIALRYDQLSAVDRTGRALPIALTVRGGSVELRVRTAGARYPLSIDPLVEGAQLSASDGARENGMGTSVAIDGSTIVVGAPGALISGGAQLNGSPHPQGAVYVFSKPAGGWANATQTAELVASDADAEEYSENVYGDDLGTSVAISGQTIVASAPSATAGGRIYAGKAYVWVEPSGGWVNASQNAELAASDATEYDYLNSIATDGQTVVAGVPNRFGNGEGDGGPGEIYVFSKPAGGWTSELQTAKLSASDGTGTADLGTSVAVSGNTIVGGAPYAKVGANEYQGALYLFTEPGSGGWKDATESAKLVVSNGLGYETLGGSVAFDGSTVVGGAPNNANPGSAPSAAYVFSKPQAGWEPKTTQPVARLTPSDPASAEHFGGSVGLSGSTIVVGAQFAPVTKAASGAAYSFSEPAGGWSSSTETEKLSAAEGNIQQAQSVGVSGASIVASAPYANSYKGAAYVFGDGGSEAPGKEVTTGQPEVTSVTPPGNTTLKYTSTAAPYEAPETFLGFPLNVPPGQPIACIGNECTYAVQVHCKAKISCAGVANLEGVYGSEASAHPKKKAKKKVLNYGKASFSIPAGKSGQIRIKLSALARKTLKQKKQLHAKLTIAVNQPGGKPVKSSRSVTIKLAKARKHAH